MSARSWVLGITVTTLVVAGQSLVPAPAAPAGPVRVDAAAVAHTWGPVKRLDRNTRGRSLVVDAHNNITVVWGTSSTPRSIVALRRPAGGGWGKRVVIGHGYAPQVAADARGNLTVVWLTQRRGFTDGVAAAGRSAGGHWSHPVRLSHDRRIPAGEEAYGAHDLALAVSPMGAVVAAWAWGSEDLKVPWRIRSVYRPAGGRWGTQHDVTPASGAQDPQVGIDAHGTAVLVYGRQLMGHPQELKARRRLAGTGWTPPVTLAAEGYRPSLAVDRAGNAVVGFMRSFTDKVMAIYRPASGRWGPARTLSPAGVAVENFALAMNGRGAAAVAMVRRHGRVDLVRRPPRGPWAAPVRVEENGTTTNFVLVALNASGDTFVGWGVYALYGRYRPHGGPWSARFTVSPDAGVEVLEETFAQVAPNGDVVVLWAQEGKPLKVRVMAAS